jgi:hypothetical protein
VPVKRTALTASSWPSPCAAIQLRGAGAVLALTRLAFGATLGVWFSRDRPVCGLLGPALATVAFGVWLV